VFVLPVTRVIWKWVALEKHCGLLYELPCPPQHLLGSCCVKRGCLQIISSLAQFERSVQPAAGLFGHCTGFYEVLVKQGDNPRVFGCALTDGDEQSKHRVKHSVVRLVYDAPQAASLCIQ